MAHVTVKINGYAYNVGCEDGQEQHLVAMADQVEQRIDSIKRIGGNTGEARLLVLASLLMADEIHDLRLALEEQQVAGGRPAETGGRTDPELAHRLGRLAVRAEEIAAEMEGPG